MIRPSVESILRLYGSIKFPDDNFNDKENYSGAGSLNWEFNKRGCYNSYWYFTIKTILDQLGNPSSHAVTNPNINDFNSALVNIKQFMSTILFPETNQSEIDYLKKVFPSFHFLMNNENLRTLLKLPDNIENTFIQTTDYSNLISDIENFNKNQRIILFGLPGTGKTTILYNLLINVMSQNDIFLAVPFKNIDLKELVSLIRSHDNIFFVLEDMNDFINYKSLIQSFDDLVVLNNKCKFIVTLRKEHFADLSSKYPSLNDFFQLKLEIGSCNDGEILNGIKSYLDYFDVKLDQSNSEAIIKSFILKSEGSLFYIKQVIMDFQSSNEEFLTLSYLQALPQGLLPFIVNWYYKTFIATEPDEKYKKLIEFKGLILLSMLFVNKYHHHFLDIFNKHLILDESINPSRNEFNIHIQDYLFNINHIYFSFSHFIYKWSLYFGLDNIKIENTEANPNFERIFSIFKSTADGVFDENFDRFLFFVKTLKETLETNSGAEFIELLVNIISNFPFHFDHFTLPFLVQMIEDEGTLDILSKNFNETKNDAYIELLDVIRRYGNGRRDIGNFEVASSSYKIGIMLSESLGLIKHKIDFLTSKAILIKRSGVYADSIELEKQIITLCIENNVTAYLADSYYNLGASYLDIKNTENAEEYITKAEEVNNDDQELNVLILVSKSAISKLKGDKNQEELFLNQGKNLAEQINNQRMIMYSYKRLANFYLNDYNKKDLVSEYLNKAEKIAKRNIYINDIIEIMFDKATLDYYQENYEETEKSLKEVYKYANEIKDKRMMSYSLTQLSSVYLLNKDINRAEEVLNQALELNQILDDTVELQIIYRNLGRIQLAKNEMINAKESFDRSYFYFEKIVNLDDSEDTFLWLNQYANMLIANNENEKSIQVYEYAINVYNKLSDRIRNKEVVIGTRYQLYLNYYSLTTKKAMDQSDVKKLKRQIINQTNVQNEMNQFLNENPNTKLKIHEFIGTMYINISQCYTTIYQITKDDSDLTVALILIDNCIEFYNENSQKVSDYQNKYNEILRIKRILLSL